MTEKHNNYTLHRLIQLSIFCGNCLHRDKESVLISKPFTITFQCRICPDFEASTWADNVKHYDTVHNGEVQYKCGLCPAWFMTNLQRLHHASTECTASKTTTMQAEQKQEKTKEMCPYCGVSYSRSYMQVCVAN